jgi:hypothetical protein
VKVKKVRRGKEMMDKMKRRKRPNMIMELAWER